MLWIYFEVEGGGRSWSSLWRLLCVGDVDLDGAYLEAGGKAALAVQSQIP